MTAPNFNFLDFQNFRRVQLCPSWTSIGYTHRKLKIFVYVHGYFLLNFSVINSILSPGVFRNMLLALFRIVCYSWRWKTSLGVFVWHLGSVICSDFCSNICRRSWQGLLSLFAFIKLEQLASAWYLKVPFRFLDLAYICVICLIYLAWNNSCVCW